MTLDIWFTNTRENEQEETFKFLKEMGAEGVSVRLGEAGFEFTCRMYADTDEDVEKVLKVLLYYNDRKAEALRIFKPVLPAK